MSDRNNQDLDARQRQLEDAADMHPAVRRFQAAVDALVDERLTDDKVEDRLKRVRRDAARSTLAGGKWSLENPNWRGFAGELAQFGYRIVQIWLRIVLVWIRAKSAVGAQRVDLTEDDIEELAQETVARAINSFRDEVQRAEQLPSKYATELKTTFLVQCVRQLPHAYRSRLLKTERLPVDRLEELAERPVGVLLVRALRHCMTNWRVPTAHLLRFWNYTDQESDAIVGMTLEVLDLAAYRYPDPTGPQTTISAHDDQAGKQ